jgi:hypothetical protein
MMIELLLVMVRGLGLRERRLLRRESLSSVHSNAVLTVREAGLVIRRAGLPPRSVAIFIVLIKMNQFLVTHEKISDVHVSQSVYDDAQRQR